MGIRKASQAIADSARGKSEPHSPATRIQKTHCPVSVSQQPYRVRVIHLLALKSYKKPELLAHSVNQRDKNSMAAILQQVANLNPKDLSYNERIVLLKSPSGTGLDLMK